MAAPESAEADASMRTLQLVFGFRMAVRGAAYLNVSALDLDFAALSGTRWRACSADLEQ